MSNKDISKYLVKEDGTAFATDNDLQALAVNSKVTNINSGLTYRKSASNVYDKTPIEVETDAVLYTEQSLTAAQKAQARLNIYAGRADHLALSPTTLDLQSAFQGTLSSIPLNAFGTNYFSKSEPQNTVIFSGDIDSGDITLTSAFTNFEALMFVYSTDNQAISTPTTWNYTIIPVWILKKAIIDKDFFGIDLSGDDATFDLTQDFTKRWEVFTKTSTSTSLKWRSDRDVHFWKIIGLGFGSGSSSGSSGGSGSSGSSGTSGSGSSSGSSGSSTGSAGSSSGSPAWGVVNYKITRTNSPETERDYLPGASVSQGEVVRTFNVTFVTISGSSPMFGDTYCFYVWKASGHTLTASEKAAINAEDGSSTGAYPGGATQGGVPWRLTYDSGSVS